MWSYPQLPADLVTFTEEILNGTLHFLCSEGATWLVVQKISTLAYIFIEAKLVESTQLSTSWVDSTSFASNATILFLI